MNANVEEIFNSALENTGAERTAFLDEACRDDSQLRGRVEALLRAHDDAGSFLDKPPAELEATKAFDANGPTDDAGRTEADAFPPDDDLLDLFDPCDIPDRMGMLAQYEIIEVIGRGGMGVVFKAHDTKLTRTVAIKILAPELASNAMASRRFLREAQAAAAVSHDHVVRIYAVHDTARIPFLVMECIDGQSLQQKIDRDGALELKEILRIGMQMAAGLSAAHKQGLVHRDIKPSNILLENGIERVKITDFGLARAVDDIGMTQAGQITGTPQYMAPEQAQGDMVDCRADLFSLGSVLYAMCTGRPAFRAETTMAVLRRVCDDIPRPMREINGDIPEPLEQIVDRLLEKNPADRFQTAEEVADVLRRYLAHVQHPTNTPPPDFTLPNGNLQSAHVKGTGSWSPTTHRKASNASGSLLGRPLPRWLIVGGLLLALSLTFAFAEANGVTKVFSTVMEIWTPRGTLVIEVDDPSLSVVVDGNGEEITVKDGANHVFTLRPGQHQIIASRDGKPIYRELVTITRGGKQVVRIGKKGFESLSGSNIKRRTEPDVWPITPLTELNRFEGHTSRILSAAISPDGRLVVSAGYDRTWRLWDIETGEQFPSVQLNGYVRSIVFSADGRYVAVCGTWGVGLQLWEIDPLPHLIRKFNGHTGNARGIRLSKDGKQLLSVGSEGSVRYWDIESGKEIYRFAIEECMDCSIDFTPNGKYALACPRKRAHLTIYLCNLQTGKTVKAIDKEMTETLVGGRLSLSPDGRTLAVPTGDGRIVVCDFDFGSSPQIKNIRTFKQHNGPCRNVLFLPDGQHIASCGSDGAVSIWNTATGRVLSRTHAHTYEVYDLAISTDGRLLLSAPGWVREPKSLVHRELALKLWQLPEDVWAKDERDPDQTKSKPAQQTISISKAGEVSYGGEKRTIEELKTALKAALKDSPSLEIRIQADADVPLLRVTEVMDACTDAGIKTTKLENGSGHVTPAD